MRTPRPDMMARRGRRSGAALLAVLWIIALLIGLVAGVSLLMLQDVEVAATRRQAFRARMISETALAVAMNPDIKPDDPLLRQQLAPDESYLVEMEGEDGFINPNALIQREDRVTFRRIFQYWGLRLQDADMLIDCLFDWVDADDFKRIAGAESKSYGMSGMPFNRPFRSVEEMALVRGMQEVEAIYPQWRSWFSVHSGGLLDVNEARPEVIAAYTGADIRQAQILRTTRVGRDGLLNTLDDAPLQDLASALGLLGLAGPQEAWASRISTNSNTRRIIVHVQVGDMKRDVAAVIRGTIGQGPQAILWLGEK